MLQDINAPVSVKIIYDDTKHLVMPYSLKWQNRVYSLTKLGLHYKYRQGNTLFHVFSVASDTLCFKLILDTSNLFWTLEQISDGLPG